jgi:hypothetical protein
MTQHDSTQFVFPWTLIIWRQPKIFVSLVDLLACLESNLTAPRYVTYCRADIIITIIKTRDQKGGADPDFTWVELPNQARMKI